MEGGKDKERGGRDLAWLGITRSLRDAGGAFSFSGASWASEGERERPNKTRLGKIAKSVSCYVLFWLEDKYNLVFLNLIYDRERERDAQLSE